MDFDVSTNKIFCFGSSEEKKAVLPVECSIILPDYFPDVMKILRYTAKTVKSPVTSEGKNEVVSGNVNIEVNYVSEEGERCSCSQLQPFSHAFECGGNIAAAEADIAVGEIGCRAVNKRRIDLHGSLDITLRTLCGEEKNLVSSVSGAGCVFKGEKTETVVPAGEFYKTFALEEKGELGYGKPPFGKILRSSAFAQVNECHVIQDKIVTKGEAKIEVLWNPETEEENAEEGPFLSVFNFPVSRMVEAEGILLTDICDASYEADFPEVSLSEDGTSLNIRLKTGIFARAYRKKSAGYISDMFSSEYETKTEKTGFSVINEAIPISLTENIIEKLDLPESAGEVTDIWAEVSSPKIDSDGEISFDAKLCMFARDGEGEHRYFEKAIEKKISAPSKGKRIAFYNLFAGIKNSEFSVGKDGKAEVSVAVLIDGTAYCAMSTEGITACSADTERKIEKDSAAVVLCYAEKGEHIWDIAKRYRAPMESIMEENGIGEEKLDENKMLIISC